MCNAMHTEFKRSTVHSNGLKPLNDFMKDMKGQYNTSLGLGEAFRNDIPERNKRRERKFSNPRFRTWNQSARFDDRSTLGGQRSGLHQHAQNASYNFDQGGRGHRNAGPSRGRGVCYAFQSGNCNRGGACRFLHPNT